MVRIISQNFLPPFQRLANRNDVELIDHALANRAVRTVAVPAHQEQHPLFENCDTDTNESYCDSDDQIVPQGPSGEGSSGEGSDNYCGNTQKTEKRKERRRQRNKMSAQAYRQRRREQSSAQQKILETLEGQNKALLQKLKSLEDEKCLVEECLKKYAKLPWHWPQQQCFPQFVTTESRHFNDVTHSRPIAVTRMETDEYATS
ncbi:hypothetical protein ScPMuIL_014748 [Solemya velum]